MGIFDLTHLYPYAVQILILAFVMVLAGIAGGGKIEILNVTLGNLGIGARIVAGVLGIALGVLFLLIPRPFFDISGRVIPEGLQLLEKNLKIELSPTRKDRNAVADDGSFKFDHISKGEYTIAVYAKSGDKLAEQERSINKGDELLIRIRKDEHTSEVTIELGDTVEILSRQYADINKDWKDRAQAIEQLTRIAGKDKSARDRLMKELQSENQFLKELSTFVLAGVGEESTRTNLEGIFSDTSRPIYRRLRAASHLMYLFSHHDAEDLLFSTVKGDSPKQGPRFAAALYLSQKGTRKICVIDQLIKGLQSQDIDVRGLMHQRLKMVAKPELKGNYDEWKKWFNLNSKKFEPC